MEQSCAWWQWARVAAQAAKRALKNKALGYLSALDDPSVSADLLERTRSATNMTDQIAALAGLCDSECAHLLKTVPCIQLSPASL